MQTVYDVHQHVPYLHHPNEAQPASCGDETNITHGFGTQGQANLINFQSMPDGDFHFLMNYIDHGVKFLFSIHVTAASYQIAARSCSGITAADNAALVSFQQSYNLKGEFPKH